MGHIDCFRFSRGANMGGGLTSAGHHNKVGQLKRLVNMAAPLKRPSGQPEKCCCFRHRRRARCCCCRPPTCHVFRRYLQPDELQFGAEHVPDIAINQLFPVRPIAESVGPGALMSGAAPLSAARLTVVELINMVIIITWKRDGRADGRALRRPLIY